MTTFSDLGLPEQIVAVLDDLGIVEPFPIQAATIADALDGRDVIGRAPTGSGKTLAFGAPLLVGLDRAERRRPRMLVLAPTRELATQIADELTPLAAAMGHRICAVYGGVGYGPQLRALERGVEVLVACPGRLEDLLSQGALTLDAVDRVVLDEADRMVDMGFLPAVTRLLGATPQRRQTLMFSATLGPAVDKLSRTEQHDPVRHEVDDADDTGDVRHAVVELPRADRVTRTAQIVDRHGSTIVFCRTRHGADRVARQLAKAGVQAAPIHGGRNQNQRRKALDSFVNGQVAALVATDVAARGIHVDDVACVIHFDPPEDDETYLHRSGRTGRAGADGAVVSLVERSDARVARSRLRTLGLESTDVDALPVAPPVERVAPSPRHGERADGDTARTGGSGRSRGGGRRAGAGSGERGRPRSSGPGGRLGGSGGRRAGASGGDERTDRSAPTTPRRRSSAGEHAGTVKFYDTKRGYGFIEVADRDDVFVHRTQLQVPALRAGERVRFELADGRKGDEARSVETVS